MICHVHDNYKVGTGTYAEHTSLLLLILGRIPLKCTLISFFPLKIPKNLKCNLPKYKPPYSLSSSLIEAPKYPPILETLLMSASKSS